MYSCVFSYDGEEDDRAIELAFAKQHADKRKEVCFLFCVCFSLHAIRNRVFNCCRFIVFQWIRMHDPDAYVDHHDRKQNEFVCYFFVFFFSKLIQHFIFSLLQRHVEL